MHSPYKYSEGLKDGIPIALGYLAVSFGFGITAVGKGLKALYAFLISVTNVTSAGQLAGVVIIVSAGTIIEMILTQLVINLRYSLMGISLSQKLDDKCNSLHRLLMSFCLTDEVFGVASSKRFSIGPSYYYGLITLPYVGWVLGTVLGATAGNFLPEKIMSAMGIMMYAMFVAIIVPQVKTDNKVIFVCIISAGLSCLFYYIPIFSTLSSGFSIIISSIVASVIVSLICPKKDQKEAQINEY